MNFRKPKPWIFKLTLICGVGLTLLGFGNPYEILGISPNASEDEILTAYRSKAKTAHPDVSDLPPELANKEFKKIQAAYEEIRKQKNTKGTSSSGEFDRQRTVEREKAKKAASAILERAWREGHFSAETLRQLPAMEKKRNFQNDLHFGRGAKEDGEWIAISEFLKRHQNEILEKNPTPQNIKELLTEIDLYTEFTGESVKDLRGGLLSPFEQYVLEKTNERNLFLEAVEDRLSRSSRTGAFPLFSADPKEREKVFGNATALFEKKFGAFPNPGESPELQLAKEISNMAFSKILNNPIRLNELDYLIRSVPSALTPEEKLVFLTDVFERFESIPKSKITQGGLRDFKARLEGKIKRVFNLHPNLQKKYATSGSWWKGLLGLSSRCQILLGRLARN